MPAWNSSSLAFSDSHNLERHKGSGLLKNGILRKSKQNMVEKKMFRHNSGKHGKDLKIGKRFHKETESKGISPSEEEFDDMMKSSVTHNPKKKKSMFSRKSFG